MNVTAAPFYLDWTFWAFVIATLALILSQVPPLRLLLRRAAITLEPYERLIVADYLGNPGVYLHVRIRNTGGRTVLVSSVSLRVTRDDGATTTLPAQMFARPENAASELIFTPFQLEAEREWANFLHFFIPWSSADERESRRLVKDLRTDIDAKLLALRPDLKGKQLVEADPARVEPLKAFFRAHRFWQPGEYAAHLVASCEPARASVERRFRFALFESDVEELDGRPSRYKYGFGVHLTDTEALAAAVVPRIRDLV